MKLMLLKLRSVLRKVNNLVTLKHIVIQNLTLEMLWDLFSVSESEFIDTETWDGLLSTHDDMAHFGE